jgi:hypothetical protein
VCCSGREASEASIVCTLEVRAPQANKKKTSTNKSRAKQAQAQAKDKCRRRQTQAPQAAKPNTRRFGAQKSTGQCGEKIEPCFCEGKLRGSTFGSLPKNEGVRLLFVPSPQPHLLRRAKPVLPEVGGGAHSPRGTWRRSCQWRRRIFFWIPPCWRRPEPMAWPVDLRSDPLFSRAVNYGAPCPIIFRPFLAPNAHRERATAAPLFCV